MGLEAVEYITDLDPSNPVGATDPKSQGDDHLRAIKKGVRQSFPNINGPVTATPAQLNTAAALAGTITGFATPTKKIGNAANADGVATTAMRSDATIQLDVTLQYTWAALHTFTAALAGVNGAITIANAAPAVTFTETDAVANARSWLMFANVNTFKITTFDDAATLTKDIMSIVRALNVVQSLTFGNATDNPTYTFLGTALTTFGGAAKVRLTHTIDGAGAGNATLTMTGVGAYSSIIDANAAGGGGLFVKINGSTIIQASPTAVLYGSVADSTVHNFQGGQLQYGGIEVGYRGLITQLKSAPYVCVQADNGKAILCGSGTTGVSLPALADSTIITIFGNNPTTITATAGALFWFNGANISSGARNLALGGVASVIRVGADWYIYGQGLS